MLDAFGSALTQIFSCPCVGGVIPSRLGFLAIGVFMGLALGVIPGLGGLVGMALLLPFTYGMDTPAAAAIMMGVLAGVNLGDMVSSVLFAVPGSAASQATILDGHPMARKGEAGRAFGAGYTASLMGGIFGVIALSAVLPVMRPIVLAFGAPEFFMMGIVGISMVGSLSGRAPIKGIIAGALGLLIGTAGLDPQSGALRWDFGQLYLWDGIPLVGIALGLFAIPELIDLTIEGTAISSVGMKIGSVWGGVRDAVKNWFLVLRCSVLGVWIGAVPGLGAPVVDWFAYGHAMQTEKGAAETFGKGDVRGVIAVEAAANAKEGGAFIPTIAFGVPGSASMALILGALLIQGIQPGPDMVTEHLDLTYVFIITLALANVLATTVSLLYARQIARIAHIPIHILAPMLLVVVFLAAFQTSRSVGDLIVLLAFSAIGWMMKRFRWPRPPVILGVVLSRIIENYLFISVSRYGWTWLYRPIVMILIVVAVFSIWYGFRAKNKAPSTSEPSSDSAI
ncbi:MAG: tripartite tricarboxylate transporter permease [Acidimicrobiia bacterium]|nr:tripartite tricarboxylate transporter permease [Acidimicrobiia bacterium]